MLVSSALRFGFLALASYGLLYFSHKYYVPVPDTDFPRYYPMYQKPLDFTVTSAPWAYRQISAIITHMVYAAGVHYPNEIAFNNAGFDQRIFFAALFTNYAGLVLAATTAGRSVERDTGGFVFPLLAGLLCLLSFHAQINVITGMTEGITWLFISVLYLLYRKQSRHAFAALLAVSIFQREIIPIVFGLIGTFSILLERSNTRYNAFVLSCSALCFAGYLLVRAFAIGGAGGYEVQLSPIFLLENFLAPYSTFTREIIFQGLLSQNVILIAIAAGTALWLKTRMIPKDLIVLLLTFGAIVVIGLAENIGPNVGRVAGMLTPAFAAVCAIILYRFEASRPSRPSAVIS